MCGIAGWASRQAGVDRGVVRAMAAALGHRGPDDSGEYFDEGAGIGLGFRRLAIRDLSAASHQPMVDRERGLVVLFNGELYNYRELRRELGERGHRFRTTGDTEVVLAALGEWGERAFERFAGMFAIAVWDELRHRLLLARDALGIKPLYLLDLPAGLAFASEVKAFLEVPGFERQVDARALAQFLELGYVFDRRRTIFTRVEKLDPGEVLVVEGGRVRQRSRHFVAPRPEDPESRPVDERVRELHDVLDEVVGQHLVADVPVGLLLSGGLDSSLVAAFAARHSRLTTVTMAFSDSAIDEREPARRVAAHLGTDHVEVEIRPDEIADEVRTSAWVFDDLFADWGTLSTRLLYRRFREMGFKVALVGEGADELFGGYPIFEEGAARSGLWGQFRLYQRYASRRWGGLFLDFRKALVGGAEGAEHDLFEAVRRFEVERQLPSNYVMKVDKASMSVSLEARTPYLDRRVAELALRTPRELLLREGENKWLLREVARRHHLLPPEISSREKFGASIAASWIDRVPSFRAFAREVVLDPSGWAAKLGLQRAMERFFSGRAGYPSPHPLSILQHLAWRLLLLNLWSRAYRDGARGWSSVAPIDAPGGAAPRSSDEPIPPGLVSVIIPVHNRPALLVEAVESAIAQTYRPIEVLIVDDGSNDDTPAVADRLARAHPQLVRVLRRENGGPGLARETGRRAARGEFIQYLDSDDLLLPRKLELQVAALRSGPEAVAAYGIAEEILPDGTVSPNPERPSDRPIARMFPDFLRLRWWQTSTPLYRVEACREIGPWTDLWLEEDWEYDCRLAALDRPVQFVPEVVCRHRHGADDRLSGGRALDARRLKFRAQAHELILQHAERAGIARETPEMQHFARELFLLARQCGAAGLGSESERLFNLARRASTARQSGGADFRLYRGLAGLIGWRSAGRLAQVADRLRPASEDH